MSNISFSCSQRRSERQKVKKSARNEKKKGSIERKPRNWVREMESREKATTRKLNASRYSKLIVADVLYYVSILARRR